MFPIFVVLFYLSTILILIFHFISNALIIYLQDDEPVKPTKSPLQSPTTNGTASTSSHHAQNDKSPAPLPPLPPGEDESTL